MQFPSGIKEQLILHLKGGHAFMPVDELLSKISFQDLGKRPDGLPYSFYEQFFHLRFTQADLLNYCLDRDYKESVWPQEYWPSSKAPQNEKEWQQLKSDFFEEREALIQLILKPETDLFGYVPSNKKHTLFREILLVIEHNAYHTGQLFTISRLLGTYSS